MKCAECSKQIPDGFDDCPWCGATPGSDSISESSSRSKDDALKGALFGLLSFSFAVLTVWLNYRRAVTWAGIVNAESIGYMFGGVLFSLLVGCLGAYVLKKLRGRSVAPATKALAITGVALLFSTLRLAEEIVSSRAGSEDVSHHVGALFKEAAGKGRPSADENWTDTATRETLHDVLVMNEQYAGEMSALDRSAIQNLYSADSYAGKVHMQRVVAQLAASLALDEKYASVDPIFKKLEIRVGEVNAPEADKQSYLKGVRIGLQQPLGRRTELIRKEQEWMKSTIDLYQFLIDHTDDYSIQDKKLIIPDPKIRKEFNSLQANAVSLHKEFLGMRKAMTKSRDEKLNDLGLSSSDFTPAQLGKTK